MVVDADHTTIKDDDHIIPKSGREIEDAAIQHKKEVIDQTHTS